MSFSLFLKPAQATTQTKLHQFSSKILYQLNQSAAIRNLALFKNHLLYDSQGELYYDNKKLDLINSNQDRQGLKINYIFTDKQDFYLATDIGIFKNFRRIFTGEACFHVAKSSKQIWISCQTGIYKSTIKKKQINEFNWKLEPKSPQAVTYFSLNGNQTALTYAVSNNGFYYFDNRKKIWLKRNFGLYRNFNNNYALGRFYVHHNKKHKLIFLPNADGVYISKNNGLSYYPANQGLKADNDGFYKIYKITQWKEFMFLASSTGLYYSELSDKPVWSELKLNNAAKSSNGKTEFLFLLAQEDSRLLACTSQGQIFQIQKSNLVNPINKTTLQLRTKEENTLAYQTFYRDVERLEPLIQEVQQHALDFAGIPQGKDFKTYRRGAKLRNFLPKLEAFLERDNQDILAIETEGKDSFNSSSSSLSTSFNQADLDRNDSSINTGLRFSWTLGNLIYDPEITDINTSARLAVNTRENILTEVTQIYYERKKLLLQRCKEIFEKSSSNNFSQEFELAEHRSQLDARTGSWYTSELKNKLRKKLKHSKDDSLKNKILEVYNAININ